MMLRLFMGQGKCATITTSITQFKLVVKTADQQRLFHYKEVPTCNNPRPVGEKLFQPRTGN